MSTRNRLYIITEILTNIGKVPTLEFWIIIRKIPNKFIPNRFIAPTLFFQLSEPVCLISAREIHVIAK